MAISFSFPLFIPHQEFSENPRSRTRRKLFTKLTLNSRIIYIKKKVFILRGKTFYVFSAWSTWEIHNNMYLSRRRIGEKKPESQACIETLFLPSLQA